MSEPEPLQLHPMFLPESDDETPVMGIRQFTIKRLAPSPAAAGRLYDAWTEIRNLEDIQRMWGGGHYEVWARDSQGMLIKGGRRKFALEGIPKPMTLDQQYDAPATYAGPSSLAAPRPAPSPAAESSELVDLRAKVNALHATMDRLAIVLEQGRTQQTQDSTVVLLQAMMKQQQDTFTSLIERLGAGQTSGGQSHEIFVEGMTTMANLLNPLIDKQEAALTAAMENGAGLGGDDMVGIAKTVEQVVRGIELFKKDKAEGKA